MSTAILGAGISGLATAWHLRQHDDVVVLEPRDRPGGNIRTERFEGCLVEWGPNGFLDNEPATLELVEALGLTGRLVRARPEAERRWIWRAGRLRELPTKPPQFLFRSVLPLTGRLRALLEPFTRPPPPGDESVRDFAKRHLGRHAADVLVDAMVTGVYAGDPRRLSLASTFPKLKALEDEHGSLLRGAKGRGFGPRGTLTSFDDGLRVLVERLAEEVDVRLGETLDTLPEGHDRVVVTAPAPRAATYFDGELARLLGEIPMAPLVVVATVFEDDIDVPDAFGFLVPRGQDLRILGTLYDSSIFPQRAPAGLRLFRTMVGGRRDSEAVDLPDEALEEIVLRDLERAWGFRPRPRATRVIRHRLGIAQYEIGHAERLARIESLLPEGVHLGGASHHGVSINACLAQAARWARRQASAGAVPS